MALRRRKQTPAPAPRREPTLAEKTSNALAQRDGAEALLRTGLESLDQAAERLHDVALEARNEAARIASLADVASQAAFSAAHRAEQVREIA